jgi:hypothetical protein
VGLRLAGDRDECDQIEDRSVFARPAHAESETGEVQAERAEQDADAPLPGQRQSDARERRSPASNKPGLLLLGLAAQLADVRLELVHPSGQL